MEFKDDLKTIDIYIGTDTERFGRTYAVLTQKYPERKKQIDDYVERSLIDLTGDIGAAVDEIGYRVKLIKKNRVAVPA